MAQLSEDDFRELLQRLYDRAYRLSWPNTPRPDYTVPRKRRRWRLNRLNTPVMDRVGVTDSAGFTVPPPLGVAGSDLVGVTDAIVIDARLGLASSGSDLVGVTDAVVVSVDPPLAQTVTNPVGVLDSLVKTQAWVRVPAPNLVGVTDSATFVKTSGANPGNPLYVLDYSTNNFNQALYVQNKFYNGVASGYTSPGYAATIVTDPKYGHVGRYESRDHDICIGDSADRTRTEVACPNQSGAVTDDLRWYMFAIKFDSTWPATNPPWGAVNQWHGNAEGPPPMGWFFDNQADKWSLRIGPGAVPIYILNLPLNRGVWQEIKMEVKWTMSAGTGYVRCWLNGAPQTFTNGSTTYPYATLISDDPNTSVYFKEGLYHALETPTRIVYYGPFRCAATQADLGSF